MLHLASDVQWMIYSYLTLPEMVLIQDMVYFNDLLATEVVRFEAELHAFMSGLGLKFDLWAERENHIHSLLDLRARVLAWCLWKDLEGFPQWFNGAVLSSMTETIPKESLSIIIHGTGYNPLLAGEAAKFLEINETVVTKLSDGKVNPFRNGRDVWKEYVTMWRGSRSLRQTPKTLRCQYKTCKRYTGRHKWGCHMHFRKLFIKRPAGI